LVWDETIWSLTSSRVKRISGSKNFRSPPQKRLLQQYPPEAAIQEWQLGELMPHFLITSLEPPVIKAAREILLAAKEPIGKN
jgi:hypothetical protein